MSTRASLVKIPQYGGLPGHHSTLDPTAGCPTASRGRRRPPHAAPKAGTQATRHLAVPDHQHPHPGSPVEPTPPPAAPSRHQKHEAQRPELGVDRVPRSRLVRRKNAPCKSVPVGAQRGHVPPVEVSRLGRTSPVLSHKPTCALTGTSLSPNTRLKKTECPHAPGFSFFFQECCILRTPLSITSLNVPCLKCL